MNDPAPKRRWLRFSLRMLFVVVTIICLVAGWVGYQLNWIRERRQVREALIFSGPEGPLAIFSNESDPRPGLSWGLRILEERSPNMIWLWRPLGESESDYLSRCARIQRVYPEAHIGHFRPSRDDPWFDKSEDPPVPFARLGN